MEHALTYRWMEHTDIPAIGALARRIWLAHYPSVISLAQIEFMLERSYTAERLALQVEEGQRFLLAERDGAAIGFLSIGALAKIENPLLRGDLEPDDSAYFLHKFYLAPECHRQGVGGSMFAELLQREPQIRRLRLQVARKNEASWKFYQKHGFTIEREADFSVGDGYEMNDFIMQKLVSA